MHIQYSAVARIDRLLAIMQLLFIWGSFDNRWANYRFMSKRHIELPEDKMKLNPRSAAALLTLLSYGHAMAQTAPAEAPAAGEPQTLDTVVISTGTRTSGLKAVDSPSPIQILDGAGLVRGAQPNLTQSLSRIVPSYTTDSKGGDAAAFTTAARLRGLSPNHTLILIDGKRLHGTANVNVTGSPYAGAAAPDISLIPLAAIERVEVLQDGAAAQYGSDAIAGVINIILKKQPKGGSITLDAGQYIDGGGYSPHASANIGLSPREGAFLNLSADVSYHGHSDRSGPDDRYDAANLARSGGAADRPLVNSPEYPYLNHTFGDAQVRQQLLTAKGGLQFGGGLEAYTLLTAGWKHAEAIQNYRGLSAAASVASVYPLGFSPVEVQDQDDYGATFGLRGQLGDAWHFDVSSTYGRSNADVSNINSLNTALQAATASGQKDFYIGFLRSTQWTTNFEVNRNFAIGWAEPLNVAIGTEFRRDSYAIGAGEPNSYYSGGVAAFPGYAPTDAGGHDRNNKALYLDVAGSPAKWAQFDAAVRAERYSDFGGASVGKLSGRFEVTPTVALRSTASTGFRAPSLAEAYYSATQVSPNSASVFLPNYASAARLLQIDQLKPEKSKNLSFGAVFRPSQQLTASLDAYQILIRDRIVQSGSLFGTVGGVVQSSLVNDAIALNGNTLPTGIARTSVRTFVNGGDSRTRGVDAVLTLAGTATPLGRVDWSVAANYNETRFTRLTRTSTALGGQSLLARDAASALEQGAPAFRLSLGSLVRHGKWTVDLRENVHGAIAYYTTIDNTKFYRNEIGTKFTTDLDVNYAFDKAWSVSVGATNLFNVYPDELNAEYRAALYAGRNQNVAKYSGFAPTGINGGYYYARATYKF
jgi:iron complex outermembrane receptor protein